MHKKDLVESNKELNTANLPGIVSSLINEFPEHKDMLCLIKGNLPEISRGTSLFQKTQSQFMDTMLTVSNTTPLRNVRQILSEIERSRAALREVYFKLKKQEIEIKIKSRDIEAEKDELKRELLDIEISEIKSNIESTRGYISGAIRKIANYIDKYNSILKSHNKEEFSELDFELEEEKYHIQKAFEQAINAARSRSGVIDEGNHIYFTQIGINGSAAQKEIFEYFKQEGAIISQNKKPTHEMLLCFLEKMSKEFEGCSTKYANYKGIDSIVSKDKTLGLQNV